MMVTNDVIEKTITMDVLNNSEKLILLFLNLIADDNGVVKIKNKYLQESTRMAENTIGKGLENLECLGLISRIYELNRDMKGGLERIIQLIK